MSMGFASNCAWELVIHRVPRESMLEAVRTVLLTHQIELRELPEMIENGRPLELKGVNGNEFLEVDSPSNNAGGFERHLLRGIQPTESTHRDVLDGVGKLEKVEPLERHRKGCLAVSQFEIPLVTQMQCQFLDEEWVSLAALLDVATDRLGQVSHSEHVCSESSRSGLVDPLERDPVGFGRGENTLVGAWRRLLECPCHYQQTESRHVIPTPLDGVPRRLIHPLRVVDDKQQTISIGLRSQNPNDQIHGPTPTPLWRHAQSQLGLGQIQAG